MSVIVLTSVTEASDGLKQENDSVFTENCVFPPHN